MGSIWKTNYLQMAANFQESAKKTNQEYHLNDLLQWGILQSSWDLPKAIENSPLPSSRPPSPTSANDLSSYFTEKIRTIKGELAQLTLLPCLVFICFTRPSALSFHQSETVLCCVPGWFCHVSSHHFKVLALSNTPHSPAVSPCLFPFSLYI